MNNKPNIFKKILTGMSLLILIKIILLLVQTFNKELKELDLIYTIAFGVTVMIFILFKVFQDRKSSEYSRIIKHKNKFLSTPPPLDNKPLHPK